MQTSTQLKTILVVVVVFCVGANLSARQQRGPILPQGTAPVLGAIPSGPGTVEGRVQRPDTKEPIAGVEITLFSAQGRNSVVSDAEGRFSFLKIALGTYSMWAQRGGYFPSTGTTNAVAISMSTVTVSAPQPN